ncbi:MAG TPA: alpha/beta fold hydrolase [Ktedonobacterales bacterium]|nr:alpha/beta fold hydrolase [Ktedonobacterales bacterium]
MARRMSRNLWRYAATAAALSVGGAMAGGASIGYYVAMSLTKPQRPSITDQYTMSPYETGADFEEVTFASRNGHMLHGWWLNRPETDRVIVGCAGYRGSKAQLVGIGTMLWRAGFNVLLFDYRGHGSDLGAPVTLGYREMDDFYAALDYAAMRMPGARIGAFGGSMGAAIAIMGSSQRPDVRAVVADSPFARHSDVISYRIRQQVHLPGEPFARISDYFLFRMAGYRGSDMEPVRWVDKLAPRPLLVIHGTNDTSIPVEQGLQVFEAAREPKELWIGEGAEHCGTYFLDRAAYCQRVAMFFDSALGAADDFSEAPSATDARSA